MANGVGVRIVPPDRVNDGIHHLSDCSLADIWLLQILLHTVFGRNVIQDHLCGLSGNGLLVLEENIVTDLAGQLEERKLS